eukprot:superscaffoldBa00001704_g11694
MVGKTVVPVFITLGLIRVAEEPVSTYAEQCVPPVVTGAYQQSPIQVWPSITNRSGWPSTFSASCTAPTYLCCAASQGRVATPGIRIVPIMRSPSLFPPGVGQQRLDTQEMVSG